jgi:hypothetical protein
MVILISLPASRASPADPRPLGLIGGVWWRDRAASITEGTLIRPRCRTGRGSGPEDDRELGVSGSNDAPATSQEFYDGDLPPQAVRLEVLEPVADHARARLLDDRVLVEDDPLGGVVERVPELESAGGRLVSKAESE